MKIQTQSEFRKIEAFFARLSELSLFKSYADFIVTKLHNITRPNLNILDVKRKRLLLKDFSNNWLASNRSDKRTYTEDLNDTKCFLTSWNKTIFSSYTQNHNTKFSRFYLSHLRHFGSMATDPLVWWKAGLGVAAASIVGYFIIKVLHSTISTR